MLGYGDRLAIVGPNGSGKTTLIRALTGELAARARARGGIGAGTVFGELDQARDLLRAARCSTTSPSCPGSRRPRRARCSRSSRSAPTTSIAPPPRSHPASARAPGSRCSRRAASTACPRRADEPPRPRGDRGARDGARGLRRLPRRRHPRPPLPRAPGGDAHARPGMIGACGRLAARAATSSRWRRSRRSSRAARAATRSSGSSAVSQAASRCSLLALIAPRAGQPWRSRAFLAIWLMFAADRARDRRADPSRSARGELRDALGLRRERLEAAQRGSAVLFLVRVRLVVQVLPALGAQPGAVGAAEDLVRQRERHRIASPLGDLEVRADDVLRPQLLVLRASAWYSRAKIGTSSTASARQR